MSKRQRETLVYLIEVLGLFLGYVLLDACGIVAPILETGA